MLGSEFLLYQLTEETHAGLGQEGHCRFYALAAHWAGLLRHELRGWLRHEPKAAALHHPRIMERMREERSQVPEKGLVNKYPLCSLWSSESLLINLT